jgi:hypothetical protein
LWSIEDVPKEGVPREMQVLIYRRIRIALAQSIRLNLLLPKQLALIPQRK